MMAKRKAKAILLDSDFSGREINVSIESGFTKVDIDKTQKFEFFTDKTTPIKVFRSGLLSKDVSDFYIFSWKTVVPLEFELRREMWKKEDLHTMLRKEHFTESEIEKMIEEIRRKENEGYNMDYFVYKTLQPVEITKDHWTKTQLPALMRDTVDMRFLKSLKMYAEGVKGGIGKGWVLIFAVIFMALIILYAMFQAGVFNPK
jgi:hypothetical protein